MTRAFPDEQPQKADAHALFGAAEDGDDVAVARLLAASLPADARLVPGGETPLMRAAARGHERVARVLLDAGADASAQRSDGFTPLILAVFFGHEAVVRLLVERGVDVSAQTSLGTTAARWAAARGFKEMADLLRAAEAASPRDDTPTAELKTADASATVDETTATTPVVTSSRAAMSPSDEVSIFSRKAERPDARGAITPALALTEGDASVLLDDSTRSVSALDVSESSASLSAEPSPELFQSDAAAGDSVQRGANAPAHPPASMFRLGHFLRSWQGAVGIAMLLLAFGVAVFALLRGGTTARDNAPAPAGLQTSTPQAGAQVQPTPLTQPTPAVPTAGQPFHVRQPAPGPVPADVPRELTVVSESGAPSNKNAARTTRMPEPRANDTSNARTDARTEPDAETRAARPTSTPEPKQRSAPPSSQSNQPPAPQPTPRRAKVIPWPPQ
jgi:hypothetical protein